MSNIDELISDLTKFNETYTDICKKTNRIPLNKEEMQENEKLLLKKGEEVINFYENIFQKKYSPNSENEISSVNLQLYEATNIAKDNIKKKNYFGLGILMEPKGSKLDDPNFIERIIDQIKKTLNKENKQNNNI